MGQDVLGSCLARHGLDVPSVHMYRSESNSYLNYKGLLRASTIGPTQQATRDST
jgi:hypothetical protein